MALEVWLCLARVRQGGLVCAAGVVDSHQMALEVWLCLTCVREASVVCAAGVVDSHQMALEVRDHPECLVTLRALIRP